MSRKERLPLGVVSSAVTANSIRISDNLPSKFPALKMRKPVLTNAINRDHNTILSKATIERQRENASKLASGRSVVDIMDKENAGARNKSIKHQFTNQIQPIGRKTKLVVSKVSKSKSVRPDRVSSLTSLCAIKEVPVNVKKIEKNVLPAKVEETDNNKANLIMVDNLKESTEPVKLEKTEDKINSKVEKEDIVVQDIEKPKLEDSKIETQVDVKLEKEIEKVTEPKPISALEQIKKEEQQSASEFLLDVYADDIYKYMQHLEECQSVRKDYITTNHIIKQNMRALLVDWLFEVQQILKLLSDTIQIAIGLFDLYMQDHPEVPRNEIQLVGISCIFLASKYEEVYPPDLDELVEVAAKTYTKSQIKKMEMIIFSSLNFRLWRPPPAQFLRRFGRAVNIDSITYCLAKYFVDLSLVSYSFCHVHPSLLAASALYLASHLLSPESDPWLPKLTLSSGYDSNHLHVVVLKLAAVVWESPQTHQKSVKNKYLDQKYYHSVSMLPQLKSEKLRKLALKE